MTEMEPPPPPPRTAYELAHDRMPDPQPAVDIWLGLSALAMVIVFFASLLRIVKGFYASRRIK